VKASIEAAADLMGIEASAFVVMSAYERAQELLSGRQQTLLSQGDHQALLAALDEETTPTPALVGAGSCTRSRSCAPDPVAYRIEAFEPGRHTPRTSAAAATARTTFFSVTSLSPGDSRVRGWGASCWWMPCSNAYGRSRSWECG
jgi:uncharacterized protein (DUF1778 family)